MNPRAIAAVVSICSLWLYIFWQIRLEWIVNPMYAYGWTIPFLAGYLFYERWNSRPAIEIKSRGIWHLLPCLIALSLILPIRVVQEANPDWVRINWLLLGSCCATTYLYLWYIGGFRYLLHFFFPIAFTFTAVAWPYNLELQIIQGLMKVNAVFSADFMTMVMGIPSRAEGNLVEVRGQWVNVEEACSGIRSLQTAFMMALFFGEFHNLGRRQQMSRFAYLAITFTGILMALYAVIQNSLLILTAAIVILTYLLGFSKRFVLVIASFALAFILNVIRTSILTYLSGTQGNESVDQWHDPLGYGILIFCIGGLWLLAERMREKTDKDQDPAKNQAASSSQFYLPPIQISGLLIAGVMLLELATELWYKPNDQDPRETLDWEATWPEKAEGYTQHEVAERTYALLKFNEHSSASWLNDNYGWSAYYIRWYPGRTSKFLAGAHYPTVCLPASGLELEQQFEVTSVTPFDGLRLDFNTFLFRRNEEKVYVFHCLNEDGAGQSDDEVSYKQVSSHERLDSVKKGYRNRGQRVIGILIEGAETLYDARQQLYENFPNYTRLNP